MVRWQFCVLTAILLTMSGCISFSGREFPPAEFNFDGEQFGPFHATFTIVVDQPGKQHLPIALWLSEAGVRVIEAGWDPYTVGFLSPSHESHAVLGGLVTGDLGVGQYEVEAKMNRGVGTARGVDVPELKSATYGGASFTVTYPEVVTLDSQRIGHFDVETDSGIPAPIIVRSGGNEFKNQTLVRAFQITAPTLGGAGGLSFELDHLGVTREFNLIGQMPGVARFEAFNFTGSAFTFHFNSNWADEFKIVNLGTGAKILAGSLEPQSNNTIPVQDLPFGYYQLSAVHGPHFPATFSHDPEEP